MQTIVSSLLGGLIVMVAFHMSPELAAACHAHWPWFVAIGLGAAFSQIGA